MTTNGTDTLIGTEGDDTLIGLGGNDICVVCLGTTGWREVLGTIIWRVTARCWEETATMFWRAAAISKVAMETIRCRALGPCVAGRVTI